MVATAIQPIRWCQSPGLLFSSAGLARVIAAELPPEALAAGLERGKSLDLETVVRGLLEEAP